MYEWQRQKSHLNIRLMKKLGLMTNGLKLILIRIEQRTKEENGPVKTLLYHQES